MNRFGQWGLAYCSVVTYYTTILYYWYRSFHARTMYVRYGPFHVRTTYNIYKMYTLYVPLVQKGPIRRYVWSKWCSGWCSSGPESVFSTLVPLPPYGCHGRWRCIVCDKGTVILILAPLVSLLHFVKLFLTLAFNRVFGLWQHLFFKLLLTNTNYDNWLCNTKCIKIINSEQ